MKLTIITPVLQGRELISQCVDNVASQGVDGVEHLIVDGGSTDGTLDLLQGLSRRHQHLRFLTGPDCGQSDAMNKGVSAARGEFIGFLNVDDFYEPGTLKEVLSTLEANVAINFLVGNCRFRDTDEKIVHLNRPSHLKHWHLLSGPQAFEYPANPSAYFYRRSLHDLLGPYDVTDHYTMDLDFILKVSASRVGMDYRDRDWGNFRLVPGTKTYDSIAMGLNSLRVNAVMYRYIHRASFLVRLKSALCRRLSCHRLTSPLFKAIKVFL